MSDNTIEFCICALAAAAAVVMLLTVESCKARSARAAYLEGRYNLDCATAWVLSGERK